MSNQTGPNEESKVSAKSRLEKPRFLVAIEFSSKEAAVNHFVDLLNTGWPKGPKEKDLKLILIGIEGEQGYIEGLELGVNRLNQVDKAIAELAS